MTPELHPKFEHVMVIDDNTIDLYITSRIIKSSGFGKNVLQYSAANEALAFLIKNQENIAVLPQIIIVDIYMPIMSGFEFMAQYEKLPTTLKRHCKVFIVSSTIDSDDIDRVNADKNVTAFKEKPISKTFLQNIA